MESNILFRKDQDITSQALNQILKGFKVIKSVEIGKIAITGAMANTRRLMLSYDQLTQGKNFSSLFVKYGRQDPNSLNFLKQLQPYKYEIQAYEVLGQTDFTPLIFYSAEGAYNQYTLLLEDLAPKYHLIPQQIGLTEKQSTIVLRTMAKFHAAFLNKPEITTKFKSFPTYLYMFLSRNKSSLSTSEFVEALNLKFDQAMKAFGSIDYSSTIYQDTNLVTVYKQIDKVQTLKAFKQVLTQLGNEKLENYTLLHWDLKCQNILFSQNEVKFVDWQTCSYGNPLVDVIKSLFVNIPQNILSNVFKNLIEQYLIQFHRLTGVKFDHDFINKTIRQVLYTELHLCCSIGALLEMFLGYSNKMVDLMKMHKLVEIAAILNLRMVNIIANKEKYRF